MKLSWVTRRAGWLLAPQRRQMLAGVLDQVIVSGGNLALGLLVLRLATKAEYGLYGLSYMTVLLVNGFGNALFGAQMTVRFYDRPANERLRFAAATFCGQMLSSLAIALAALAAAAALPGTVLTGESRVLVVLVACAGPAAMAHDFFRSYFFLIQRAQNALALDLALTMLWAGLTAGLAILGGVAPHVAALLALACSAAATSTAGLLLARLPLREAARHSAATFAEGWQQGRWALGGVAISALQNQAPVYLLGILGAASAVADLNAARMLLAPMSVLMLGINRTQVPQMARLLAEDRQDDLFRRYGWQIAGLLIVIATYSMVVLLGRNAIIGAVLDKDYGGIGPLLLGWAVVLMLQAIDNTLSAGLQVSKRFRSLTLLNLITAIPVCLAVAPMVLWLGALGALLTLAGGYTGLTLLLWRDLRHSLAQHAASRNKELPQ